MRIAITGFGGLDLPDSGLSVARALRAGLTADLTIHALGYDPVMTSAWMPGVADFVHRLPRPDEREGRLLARLLALHERHGFDVLIPCVDDDIAVFSSLASVLRKVGIRLLVPEPAWISRLSRANLPDFVFEHQILAPASIYVSDPERLRPEAERLRFPLLVKNETSRQQIATNAQELATVAARLGGFPDKGVILQQIVAGEEFSAAVVVGREGRLLGQITIRKLAINDNGEGECGAVVEDPWIEQFVQDFLKVIDWRGPLVMDFVRPQGSTQPWLKDIQCRFPSWIILSHWAGVNLPAQLVSALMETPEQPAIPRPRPGAVFLHGVSEATVPASTLAALEKVGSAQGNHRRELFSVDDADSPDRRGISVAVTGISSFNMINPGLGVARALRRAPEIGKVYGLNYGTFDSGSYQANLVDEAFRLPITDSPRELLARIREIHARRLIDVLIPCLDGELPRFFAIRDELEALGIALLLPSEQAFERREKLNLFTGDRDLGADDVTMPRTFIAYSLNDIYRAISQFGGPVAVKGPLFGCVRVDSPDEAPKAWKTFSQQGEDRVIVQPWVAGEMIAVATVCDRNHKALSVMTARKLANCHRGSTWSAEVVSFPRLEAVFTGFLERIEWVGPAEGEFLYDEQNGRFYLLEINPRFTGWIAFSGETGVNHPLVAVKAALGETPAPRKPRTDLIFMRSSYAIEVDPVRLASLSVNGQVINNG